MSVWSKQQALETYSIPHWGGGYFDINEDGHLAARPDRDPGHGGVDIYRLVQQLATDELALPVLVRFKGILQDRVDTLCNAFEQAIKADDYRGRYHAVYPIKVNQQRFVVEELVRHGAGRLGLEAGSKPELMAVLAVSQRNGVIVCNGYKDVEYIRLALLGQRLGMRVFIVLEKLSELDVVLRESQDLGITPLLGIRVRLSSIAGGKWQNSGGEKAKFGLSAMQVLQAVQRLRDARMLDALRMVHFHMGSQIANIRDIQKGIRECSRFYAELHAMGVPVDTVDVGGGLGVDYEGTRSRSFCSMNYGVHEYANNIVHTLWECCEELGLPHPDIISESGRALTAHHAVLITQVIDQENAIPVEEVVPPAEGEALIVKEMWQTYTSLKQRAYGPRSRVEIYHDAVQWFNEVQGMYLHGVLNLEQRAMAEQLYFLICKELKQCMQPDMRAHRDILDELNEKLADKYFCNYSLFQSMPDVWGIEQVFPVVPLHRLNEKPTRRIVIEDVTCDSDGRIDRFIDNDSIETSLPAHELRQDEPYLLGMFMVGAYQEILGDMHNLFGDTNSVNVELLPDGRYRCYAAQAGDTVDSVLRYVNFEPEHLKSAYREKLAASGLNEKIQQETLEYLISGIEGYTYLEE